MKSLKRIVALSALLLLLLALKWWIDRGVGTIVLNALVLPPQNARAVALQAASGSLDSVKEPNFYAYITQADLQYAIDLALKKRSAEASGEDPVTFSSASVLLRPEGVAITLPFRANRLLSAVQLDGQAELEVAPSANGSNIDLVPMTARVRLDRLQIGPWTFSAGEGTTLLAASVLNGVLTFAASRVASLSVPLTFGGGKAVDIATLAPGFSISGGKQLNIRLGAERVAIVPSDGGLNILGRLISISESEFQQTVTALETLRSNAINAGPASGSCQTCEIAAVGIGGYFACARERAVCEARRQLRTPSDADIRLTAPQALVLSELKNDPTRRELYKFFEPMLLPYGVLDENPPEELTEIKYAAGVRAILGRMLTRIKEVDNPSLLTTPTVSRVAIQRKFIAQTTTTVLELLRSEPLSVTFNETREESLARDIVTDPAPDLNCDKNARHCDGFTFRDEPNRPCPSDSCATNDLKCVFGICTNVPGVNLNCQGKKVDCERLKLQEKTSWAGERAGALTAWKVRHDACELAKAAELSGCRINQKWLNSWNGQKLGHLDGVARISNSKAEFRLDSINVADDLSTATVEATIAGGAHVGASVVYKPSDSLQGRLVCLANWGGDLKADVSFKPQSIRLRAALAQTPEGGVIVRSEPETLLLTMTPPPGLALLRDTPQMAIACPAVGVPSPSPVGLATVVVLAITDTFKIPVKGMERRFGEFEVAGSGRKVNISLAPLTVIATFR